MNIKKGTRFLFSPSPKIFLQKFYPTEKREGDEHVGDDTIAKEKGTRFLFIKTLFFRIENKKQFSKPNLIGSRFKIACDFFNFYRAKKTRLLFYNKFSIFLNKKPLTLTLSPQAGRGDNGDDFFQK